MRARTLSPSVQSSCAPEKQSHGWRELWRARGREQPLAWAKAVIGNRRGKLFKCMPQAKRAGEDL
eukprot:3949695-Alexandrium_andersonii.AAC.1